MPTIKNKKTAKKLPKGPRVVIVTKTVLPEGETSFPEKLKKANEILSRTKFMDDRY